MASDGVTDFESLYNKSGGVIGGKRAVFGRRGTKIGSNETRRKRAGLRSARMGKLSPAGRKAAPSKKASSGGRSH